MRITTLVALSFSTTLVGCAADTTEPEVLSYEEFKALAYQEPESGVFIINGDEIVETEEAMQHTYDAFLQSVTDARLRDVSLHVDICTPVGGHPSTSCQYSAQIVHIKA